MFLTREVRYEKTLSSAIHHSSNVNLLQENVTPCCLTETEHISFATVTSTTLQLTNHDNLHPTKLRPPDSHLRDFIHRKSFAIPTCKGNTSDY
jgi:hypothetical protein